MSLSALRALSGYTITAPVFVLGGQDRDTRREPPTTGEKIADRYGSPSARFRFLAHPDGDGDSEEIRAGMRKMMTDPYVKTAWLTQVLTVASQDFQVHAADDDDQLARQMAEFCERAFQRCDGGMVGVATNLLGPLGPAGYTLAEKVWKPVVEGRDKGRVQLRAIKARRPSRVRIETDRFNNVVGVQPLNAESADVTYPISDFVYLRYFSIYDDPDGMPAFRASYSAYWMHDTVKKLRIIHHERKIGGMLVGTYQDERDQSSLELALAAASNRTWMAIPEGTRIEALAISTASDSEYAAFVEDCRVDIVTGIAFASLQILQGQTSDARGDTKVQKATSDLAAWYLTSLLQSALDTQVIPDLCDYNFSRIPNGEYPTVTFGAVSNQELIATLDLITRAQQAGFKPSKKYYSKVLTIQEADPNDPDDVLQAPGQGGGMGGMFGGMGGGMPPDMGGQPPDPFGMPPEQGADGMDPMAQAGQPEGLFSDRGDYDLFAFDPNNYEKLPDGRAKSQGGRVLSKAQFDAAVKRYQASVSKKPPGPKAAGPERSSPAPTDAKPVMQSAAKPPTTREAAIAPTSFETAPPKAYTDPAAAKAVADIRGLLTEARTRLAANPDSREHWEGQIRKGLNILETTVARADRGERIVAEIGTDPTALKAYGDRRWADADAAKREVDRQRGRRYDTEDTTLSAPEWRSKRQEEEFAAMRGETEAIQDGRTADHLIEQKLPPKPPTRPPVAAKPAPVPPQKPAPPPPPKPAGTPQLAPPLPPSAYTGGATVGAQPKTGPRMGFFPAVPHGKPPTAPKPAPKPAELPADHPLVKAYSDIRDRAAAGASISEVQAMAAGWAKLPKADLDALSRAVGYHPMPTRKGTYEDLLTNLERIARNAYRRDVIMNDV